MKGAREYAQLFEKSQQQGRLFFHVDQHASGSTFRIFVLHDILKDVVTYSTILCVQAGGYWNGICRAVEVYGIIKGDRGWDEEYGWIYKGKWCEDFERIVEIKKNQVVKEKRYLEELKRNSRDEEKIKALLDAYEEEKES